MRDCFSQFFEFIGIILGDGHILYDYQCKKKLYNRISIYGDIHDDQDYFRRLSYFLHFLSNKKPKMSIRKLKKGMGLILTLNNKEFVHWLVNNLGIPYGKKVYTVSIPERFLEWEYSKHILRGLFEADGSLYFSKSKITRYPTYPRLEFRTVSKKLAFQIFNILLHKGFNVKIMKTKYKDYKVYLSGNDMLSKWINEVGFSNHATLTKYLVWKSLGYYIPRLSLKQRETILNGETTSLHSLVACPSG